MQNSHIRLSVPLASPALQHVGSFLKAMLGPVFLLVLLLFGEVREALAQKPRLVIPTGQSARLAEYQFSPNGRYLLTGETSGTIVVWEMATRREVLRFRGHQASVWAIAVAPDGHTVASGDDYGNVIWWDLATGRLLKKIPEAHYNPVRSMQFSADGHQLLTGAFDGEMATWDVATRTLIKKYQVVDFPVTKLAFHPDGTRFLCVAPDTSKRDDSSNLTYGYPVADSLVYDVNFSYSSALLTDACLLPNGRGFASVTTEPAELRLRSLPANEATGTVALPRLRPFAVEPLDSTHLLIGAIRGADTLVFLRYSLRERRLDETLAVPYTIYNDNLLLRVVPGTGGQQVALGRYNDYRISRYWLPTGRKDELNPTSFETPSNALLAHDRLYLDGLREWDLKANTIQKITPWAERLSLMAQAGDSLLYWRDDVPGYWSTAGRCTEDGVALPGARYWEGSSGYLSPDGRFTAYTVRGGNLQIRRRSPNQLYCTVPKGPRSLGDVAWLGGSRTVVCQVLRDSVLLVFDVQRRKMIRRLNTHRVVQTVVGLPNGNVLVCHAFGRVALYEPLSGRKIKEVVAVKTQGHQPAAEYIPALGAIRLSYEDGTIHWLDPGSLRVRQTWTGHQSRVTSLVVSPDKRRAFTTSFDGCIRVWDAATGHSILAMSSFSDEAWVAFTEDGLFDASPAAMKQMYYVVNDSADAEEPWKIIELGHLKARYYQPDLLRIQLGYSSEPLREVPRLEQVDLAPKVAAQITDPRTLTIHLRNQRGGIGAVSVYLDDAEIVADARPRPARDANQAELTIALDLKKYAGRFYPGRPNQLRIVVWNRDHWISAAPVSVSFTPNVSTARGVVVVNSSSSNQHPAPRLYGLVFGTSDYAGTQADLRYSSKDAVDFAAALRGAAERLYGPDGVELSLYHSEASEPGNRPSRQALRTWFAGLNGKVKPWDVLVVYLAGHGVSTNGASSDFYYLTQEATRADAEALSDPAVRDRCAVSSQELTQWLNRLACRKKVLILDACASGRAAETMAVAARDVPASQVRALDRLTDRTGFYILSGSAADAVSYESGMYSQGLLTYALLKALKGAALRPDGGEEYADVQRLLQYAVDEVPQLAQAIGGQQKPLYRSPDSQQSFDLGRVDAAVKASITLAEPKPVFMAASFLSAERLFDELGLADKLNAELREATARGKDATLAFTEARDYPGAYRVSGTYERAGTTLRMRYVVLRGSEQILPPQVFEANFSQPAAFVAQFLTQLVPRLK